MHERPDIQKMVVPQQGITKHSAPYSILQPQGSNAGGQTTTGQSEQSGSGSQSGQQSGQSGSANKGK